MSGDKIFMNYFACLGPIDPQIEKDGKLVPALSYLNQFQRLSDKEEKGTLNTAEFALLNKLDLGELYQFEQARELSRLAYALAIGIQIQRLDELHFG
jgi:ClpP class serine protease